MNKMTANCWRRWLAATYLMLAAAASCAQDYPTNTVKFIVWVSPGGSIDTLTRMIVEKLGQRWKRSVIVENKPGASGIIASEFVARAPADGHTLLVTINTSHINVPILQPKVSYDPVKDFAPVSQLAIGSVVLLAPSAHPANNVGELITWAKKKGGMVNYGSWGIGSSAHLFGEQLKRVSGVDFNHVAYKGEMPGIIDMLGGTLDVTFAGGGTARAQVAGGKVKVLGVAGPRRIKTLPSVSTFAEQGLSGFDVAGWVGVYAPAKTPKEIVRKIAAELAEVVRLPDLQARMIENGFDPVGGTPEQFETLYRDEFPKWASLIKASGAKSE